VDDATLKYENLLEQKKLSLSDACRIVRHASINAQRGIPQSRYNLMTFHLLFSIAVL